MVNMFSYIATRFAYTVIVDAVPPPGSVAPIAQYAVTIALAEDPDPLIVSPSWNIPLYIADNSNTTTDCDDDNPWNGSLLASKKPAANAPSPADDEPPPAPETETQQSTVDSLDEQLNEYNEEGDEENRKEIEMTWEGNVKRM